MGTYRQLLELPGQKRLLAASLPADFADWLDYVAVVALLVYGWKEGPLTLALFALALASPYVLVGPFVAALVDRSDLRLVLVASNIGRALATAALMLAPNAIAVLAIVFVRGAIDSAFTPARQAALQVLTPEDHLATANGAHQSVNQLSKIVGPAIGGFLLTVTSVTTVFAINATLSAIAALVLVGLKLPGRAKRDSVPASIFAEMPAGLAALIFASCAYFAFFLYDTLIALLAVDLGFAAGIYGLAITASGIGGLLGALLAGRLRHDMPIRTMALAALVSAPVTILLAMAAMTGVHIGAWAFFVAMAVMGGSTSLMLVPYRTIIQTEAPRDSMARVVATGEAITMAVMLSAPFIGSLIGRTYGVAAAFLAGGMLLLLIGGSAMLALLNRERLL